KIPKVLHEHINTAFPINVCLVATVLPDGFAQVTPRGSTMVFDDEHLALWERGKGTTNQNLKDGTKVTVFFRKPQLREAGILPKGGIVRFYGTATLHTSGPVRAIGKNVVDGARVSRFRDVGIKTGILRSLHVYGTAVSGQGDQNDVVKGGLFADLACDFIAAHDGQSNVDKGEVGMLGLDCL